MTAPADVWAVETLPMDSGSGETGTWKLEGDNQQMPLFWNTRAGADDFAQNFMRPSRVVRFRLVRADEPEQPQREDPHAMENALTDFLKGYCPFSATQLQSAVHALCRMAIKGQSDLDRLRDTVRALADAVCGPEQPREDVGELRECVATLAHAICELASHCGEVTADAYSAPQEAHNIALTVLDRLAAPEQSTPVILPQAATRLLAAIDAMDGMICHGADLLVLDGPAAEFNAAVAGLRAAVGKAGGAT